MSGLSRVRVTRYVTPLREGGSLPGIVEASDLGTYVCKFVGAGQGARVLVAEVLASGIASLLELRTPRLVGLDLDPEIARYEADEEVQDLLTASVGLNLGVDFLPGAFGYDAAENTTAAAGGRTLWLDAYLANVDRTWRNPNLLVWHGQPWVIDHGASLYFHHSWPGGVGEPGRFAAQPWDPSGHVFATCARAALRLDAELRALLSDAALARVVAEVPDEWLTPVPGAATPEALRAAYLAFLTARRDSDAWLAKVAAS